MDIRKTEEFKAKQQKIIEDRQKEEISAINIVKSLRRTEELREILYEGAELGYHGPMVAFGIIGCCLSIITVTPKFSEYFPKAARFFQRSFALRLLIVLFFARTGLYLEQNYYENKTKKKEYQDYMSSYLYTNDLITRRLEKIDYIERLYLCTGIDLKRFLNKD